jgi:hypothetical protein
MVNGAHAILYNDNADATRATQGRPNRPSSTLPPAVGDDGGPSRGAQPVRRTPTQRSVAGSRVISVLDPPRDSWQGKRSGRRPTASYP